MQVFCWTNVLKCFIFVEKSYPFQLICQTKAVLIIFSTSLCFDGVILVPIAPYDIAAPNGMIAPYKTNELGQLKEKSRKKKF